MLTYLFPGQGSQFRGMGKDLFSHFADYTALADKIVGYSIAALCTEDADNRLHKTQYTQPALYVVNALTYLKALHETLQKPDYVAGHSLGEYNALLAAEVFDFATGLTLVKKRGELMSQAQAGGMMAVLGLNKQELIQRLADNQLNHLAIANHNSYHQIVISGLQEDINTAQKILEATTKARAIPLPVSGAFHSPYMISAQKEFEVFLEQFSFSIPKIPIVSNVKATLYHPAAIKKHLIQQITHPVEWTKSINYLQRKPNMAFKEIGPGNVLTGLMQRIVNGQ